MQPTLGKSWLGGGGEAHTRFKFQDYLLNLQKHRYKLKFFRSYLVASIRWMIPFCFYYHFSVDILHLVWKLKCIWRETSLISRMTPFFISGFRPCSGNSGSSWSFFPCFFFYFLCESAEDFGSLDWLFSFFCLNHLHIEKEEGVVFCSYCCSHWPVLTKCLQW